MADAEALRLLALQSLRRKADEVEEGEARATRSACLSKPSCLGAGRTARRQPLRTAAQVAQREELIC